ncbi:MAG: hypothetical protein GF334_01765, partial [Candidatus Altiarchaeales archaeon]|nr:hypothetical protein [Candidatus Altiarchaeales archaeon]
MERMNPVYERKNSDGTTDYIVNLGTVLYNNRTVSLAHRIIPIRGQNFFTLPADRGKYAVVNCYYKVESGQFVFDKVGTYSKYVSQVTAPVLHNLLPIAQFVIKQKLRTSFEVISINSFSRMSTFTISSNFVTGQQGARGPLGYTGLRGVTGIYGDTGLPGEQGITGIKGATGVGSKGEQGIQGEAAVASDASLLLYLKFKADADLQPDYSLYRRDCVWSTAGSGVTGGYLESSYTTEDGI